VLQPGRVQVGFAGQFIQLFTHPATQLHQMRLKVLRQIVGQIQAQQRCKFGIIQIGIGATAVGDVGVVGCFFGGHVGCLVGRMFWQTVMGQSSSIKGRAWARRGLGAWVTGIHGDGLHSGHLSWIFVGFD
jgi:hypothetical protein